MIRTVKKAIANVRFKDEKNVTRECDVEVVANNEKELRTTLNKELGRNKYFINSIEWASDTYELDDATFFSLAKKISK